jgi:flagella basal body P-ring formation protein FlgA
MLAKRAFAPGQPFVLGDLARPAAVKRDSPVRMVLDTAGLSLSGQGIALDSAAVGERVRVRNPASRAELEAEVVGVGVVRVAPGAIPIQPERLAQGGGQ